MRMAPALRALVVFALLAAPLGAERLVYSTDPNDPWNRIHRLLLTEPEGRERPRPLLGWPGDDAPDFFFESDPGPPRSGPGLRHLMEALEHEARSPHLEGRTIEARLLFQQDLWRIFDETFKDEGGAAEELRDRLGRLLSRLAPALTELASLRSSWSEIATAFPLLETGMLDGTGGWRELRAVFRNADATSLHAHTAGHRRVFRAFVWLPPGVRIGDLGSPDSGPHLPHGSRVALVETLVALASTGELRPVPLVVGVEVRHTPPPGRPDEAVRLVLHASPVALSRSDRVAGGLRSIPDEALVRSTLGCYPFGGSLEPLRAACFRCHGPTGRMLQTGVGGSGVVEGLETLDPRNTREQGAVLRRKTASREYRALVQLFRATDALIFQVVLGASGVQRAHSRLAAEQVPTVRDLERVLRAVPEGNQAKAIRPDRHGRVPPIRGARAVPENNPCGGRPLDV